MILNKVKTQGLLIPQVYPLASMCMWGYICVHEHTHVHEKLPPDTVSYVILVMGRQRQEDGRFKANESKAGKKQMILYEFKASKGYKVRLFQKCKTNKNHLLRFFFNLVLLFFLQG